MLALGLVLPACAHGWQEVALTGTAEPVAYLRRPLPNEWVGTEQERRLRVGDRGTVALPVQMGAQDPVAVYDVRGSAGRRLYVTDPGSSAVVDLDALGASERSLPPDSLGALLGVVVSPEGGALRFVPG